METLKLDRGDICVYTGPGIYTSQVKIENGDMVRVEIAIPAEGRISVQYDNQSYFHVPIEDLYKVSDEFVTASKPMNDELAKELGMCRVGDCYKTIIIKPLTDGTGTVNLETDIHIREGSSAKEVVENLLQYAYNRGCSDQLKECNSALRESSDLEKAALTFLTEASKSWWKQRGILMNRWPY
jgi:hypothetical protein